MTPAGHRMLRHGRIVTAASDNMCGVHLDIGRLYVIAGKAPLLNLCHYAKEYKKMSIIERTGFNGLYRKACKCEVSKTKFKYLHLYIIPKTYAYF